MSGRSGRGDWAGLTPPQGPPPGRTCTQPLTLNPQHSPCTIALGSAAGPGPLASPCPQPVSGTACLRPQPYWQVPRPTLDTNRSAHFWILQVSQLVSSDGQSCPTLCDPMDCSTPGLPVHHQLPEFGPNSGPLSRWCHPTISSSVVPFSSCPQSFPASGSFQGLFRVFHQNQLFTSGGQSIGVSASTSVLSMNIQDWFPLGWTGWISLQSKGLSRVFSNTTVQKHQFFSAQLPL